MPFKFATIDSDPLDELWLYASHTQALPASFVGTKNANGCYDLNFAIRADDNLSTKQEVSTNFVLEYCDCTPHLNFAAQEVYKKEGMSQVNPTAGGVTDNDFYEFLLTSSSVSTNLYFMSTADVTLESQCGSYTLSMTPQTGFTISSKSSKVEEIIYSPSTFPTSTKQADVLTVTLKLDFDFVPVPTIRSPSH